MQIHFMPQFIWQAEVTTEDGVGAVVVQGQTLCHLLQLAGCCKLRAVSAFVQHERCACAGPPITSAQVSDYACGRYLAGVIERHFNGHSAEQVVQENSIP